MAATSLATRRASGAIRLTLACSSQQSSSAAALVAALEAAGVLLLPAESGHGLGVRMRQPDQETQDRQLP